VGPLHSVSPLRVADRYLPLNEEVFHRAQAVSALALGGERILSAIDGSAVPAQARDIGVLSLLPRVIRHVTTLVTVDVGVAAGAVRMVVDGLGGGGALLGVAELPVCSRVKLSILGEAALGCLILLRVATVIETDVGVAPRTICMVNPSLSNYLEEFA
jgi:hypothetical protein